MQYRSTIPSRAPVALEVASKPLAAARVLQGDESLTPVNPCTPGETGSCRSQTDPQYCGPTLGNDPGRVVFIGPPQALQILTSIPRRPHLRGPIENTLQPLRLYTLQGATHSFAFGCCLIRLFSSISLFISSGFFYLHTTCRYYLLTVPAIRRKAGAPSPPRASTP